MSILLRSCLAGAAALLAAACDWTLDSRQLTAESPDPQASLTCAACHTYPEIDNGHYFHSTIYVPNHADNGPVTCLDCHATSIASRMVPVLDSIFTDSFGDTLSSLNNPYNPDVRTLPMIRVDTLKRQQPLVAPGQADTVPPYQEYLTSLAHLNGVLDVAFDLRSSESSRSRGTKASYDPVEQTCSAVACHRRGGTYEWSRLLPETP